jgi:hypothetical protein
VTARMRTKETTQEKRAWNDIFIHLRKEKTSM